MGFFPRQKLSVAIGAMILAFSAGVYGLFYAPLIADLSREGSRASAVEKQAAEAHAAIASYRSSELAGSQRRLLTEEEVSEAIHELSRTAQIQKVRFISLSPGQAAETGDHEYRTQSLQIEAESSFEDLGVFLSGLDEQPLGIFTVKGLDAAPDPRDKTRIKTRLTLDLYLEGGQKSSSVLPPARGIVFPKRAIKKNLSKSWDTDPFVPETRLESPIAFSDLVLNGIAYDKTNPAAILNDRIVRVGDFVGPYQVTGIDVDKVTVTDGDSSAKLTLDQQISPDRSS